VGDQIRTFARRCRLARAPWLLLAALLLWAPAAPVLAQSYDAGMDAYDAGDYDRARLIWAPLAEGGDPVAQYSLGKLYERGGGVVEKDLRQAAEWYRKAATQGVAAAQNNLGLMYAQGRGVPRDPARAAELWQAAARQTHPIAQFNLGLAFFRGEGVAEDKTEAERWFRRAAEGGLAEAQYALGQVKRFGLTGPVEEKEALAWYLRAAAQGHAKAREQAAVLRQEGVTAGSGTKTAAAAAPTTSDAPPPEPAKAPTQTAEAPSAPAPAQTAPETTQAPAETAAGPSATEPAETPAQDAGAEPPGEQVALAAPAQSGGAADAEAMAGEGGVRLWLVSARNQEEAGAYLSALRDKHPEVFAEVDGFVAEGKAGEGGTFYRVLARGIADEAAGRGLCARLRGADPQAFCKVLPAAAN
jgi:TPR repeat protein